MHERAAILHLRLNEIKARRSTFQATVMQQRTLSYPLVALCYLIFHPQRTTWRLNQERGPRVVSCRSPICWTEMGESFIIGPDLIRDTSEKACLILQRLLTAQSWQKRYTDRRRRPLEFEVGDHVFLKVMPKRKVVRFGKRGKLTPRYIRPFEILERVGTVAYRLALPPSLSGVHEVFHISMLRKYTPDPAHVVDWREIIVA